MKSLSELDERARQFPKVRLAVANAVDASVLEAVVRADANDVADAILVGKESEIRRIADEHSIDLSITDIVDAPTDLAAAAKAVELVRSGVLGKIHTVRLWKNGGSPNYGYPREEEPPKELDWNTWLGPAPWRPYVRQRCHHTFRSFWDYSGGVYADFWCHIADIFFWSMNPGQPKTIEARGEVPDGIADTPAWIDVDYEFPDLKVYWTTRTPDVPGAAGKGQVRRERARRSPESCRQTSRYGPAAARTRRAARAGRVVRTLPAGPAATPNVSAARRSRASKPPRADIE